MALRPSPWPSALLAAALVWLFVAVRVLRLEGLSLWFGAALVAAVMVVQAVRLARAPRDGSGHREVQRRVLGLTVLVGLGVTLYFLGASFFEGEHVRVVVAVLWPLMILCGALPLALVELTWSAMDGAAVLERRRIDYSTWSGLVVAQALGLLFALNYVASELNVKWDLSYFRTTAVGEVTKHMLAELSAPLTVTAFVPEISDVREDLVAYLGEVQRASDKVTLEVLDQAYAPKRAKELEVRSNGYLVLASGEKKEKLLVGTDLKAAKKKLQKLDSEFQKLLLKVVRAPRVAYFITGHEERDFAMPEDDPRAGLKDLKQVLESQNYKVKRLGLTEGLGEAVPEDATVVFLIGPQKPLFPGEEAALVAYVQRGGRVWLALEPSVEAAPKQLLAALGVELAPEQLANDQYFLRGAKNQPERTSLVSNKFSSHASVSTLSRNSTKLALLMLGAGHLTKVKDAPGKIDFVVRSMDKTWADADRDQEYDDGVEKRSLYNLAAAVSLGEGDKEQRAFVIADADALADEVLRNTGNLYLVADGLKWLAGEEALAGETENEEDIPIAHSDAESALWFYATIFGVPALVLGGGIGYTRRRLRKAGGRS